MTHGELELLTDIRDFANLLYWISRFESSEWLESSIESRLIKESVLLAYY